MLTYILLAHLTQKLLGNTEAASGSSSPKKDLGFLFMKAISTLEGDDKHFLFLILEKIRL